MRRVSELEDIQHREAISRKAPQFRKMITMPKKKKRIKNGVGARFTSLGSQQTRRPMEWPQVVANASKMSASL